MSELREAHVRMRAYERDFNKERKEHHEEPQHSERSGVARRAPSPTVHF